MTSPKTGKVYVTQIGSITSGQLQHSLTDETGREKTVFSNSPNFTGTTLASTTLVDTSTD